MTDWRMVLLAIFAAVGAAALAPAPWAPGSGMLEVTRDGVPWISGPIVLDAGPEQTLIGSGGAATIAARTGQSARVAVNLQADEPLSMETVRVALTLADGRSELVPLTRAHPDGTLSAARRPPAHAPVMLGLLALVVLLWVSEALPLHVTSLLVPIVLVTAGAAPAGPALAPFFHPIIALFFGAFLLAAAIHRVGLDHLLAVGVIHVAGRSPVRLYSALLLLSAFLSMWMSNTAAAAVLIPIAIAISTPLDDLPYRKTLVLGIAYAATIGGVGSAIGTPANPIAIAFLQDTAGRTVTFAQWFAFGLPMVVLFLPVMGLVLWRSQRVRLDPDRFHRAVEVAQAEWRALPPLSRPQWTVLAVLAVTVIAWLTDRWHGVHSGIVALAAAVALTALGTVGTRELRGISWESLLTFGGGLTLGSFLASTGMSDWVATRMEAFAAVPGSVAIALVAALALGLTTVASNTASAAVLVPLAIPLAAVLGVDPVVLVLVVAIASSVDFALVIGTPPTMMAYSTRLFTAGEIFRVGIVLDVLGILLLVTAVVGSWRLLGLV